MKSILVQDGVGKIKKSSKKIGWKLQGKYQG
jgi:hypothetical protein